MESLGTKAPKTTKTDWWVHRLDSPNGTRLAGQADTEEEIKGSPRAWNGAQVLLAHLATQGPVSCLLTRYASPDCAVEVQSKYHTIVSLAPIYISYTVGRPGSSTTHLYPSVAQSRQPSDLQLKNRGKGRQNYQVLAWQEPGGPRTWNAGHKGPGFT